MLRTKIAVTNNSEDCCYLIHECRLIGRVQTYLEGGEGESSPRETCRQEGLITFAPRPRFSKEKLRWKAETRGLSNAFFRLKNDLLEQKL